MSLAALMGNGNTGQLETDDFFLNIVDDSGTLVQIVDKVTGESTETLKVSGFKPRPLVTRTVL
ncbi:hypothetical protein O9929_04405 [Vibrio lentus]|nr:hypothetical protein [Vibrio lentus]